MGYKETISRNQVMLVDLENMVAEDSECRVIDIFCETLDMAKLGFKYSEPKETGCPPYSPKALLKLYLYGLLNRICSSGKLSIEAKRNIEVIWLINGLKPSKRTLCYFKENNKEALRKVFTEFNEFYKKIGLFGKKLTALDSVKVKANNSKKRNHNKKTVEKTIQKTEERINEYMTALDEADKNEGLNEERALTMTADTGYHDGKDMLKAEKNGITCLVPKGKPGNQRAEEGYKRDKFAYDEEKDIYICPQNQVLKKISEAKDSNGDKAFIYANYSACSHCPHRSKCTKGKNRQISRKSFQTDVDKLDARFIKRKGEYKKRQEIIEHQFGTVKWVWGFDRYYTKGTDFAQAENALRFTAYNLRRAINIIGARELIELIKALLPLFLRLRNWVAFVFSGIFRHNRLRLRIRTR